MTNDHKLKVIRRISSDLKKEALRHRRNGEDMAATECEGLAYSLAEISQTLAAVDHLQKAILFFTIQPQQP